MTTTIGPKTSASKPAANAPDDQEREGGIAGRIEQSASHHAPRTIMGLDARTRGTLVKDIADLATSVLSKGKDPEPPIPDPKLAWGLPNVTKMGLKPLASLQRPSLPRIAAAPAMTHNMGSKALGASGPKTTLTAPKPPSIATVMGSRDPSRRISTSMGQSAATSQATKTSGPLTPILEAVGLAHDPAEPPPLWEVLANAWGLHELYKKHLAHEAYLQQQAHLKALMTLRAQEQSQYRSAVNPWPMGTQPAKQADHEHDRAKERLGIDAHHIDRIESSLRDRGARTGRFNVPITRGASTLGYAVGEFIDGEPVLKTTLRADMRPSGTELRPYDVEKLAQLRPVPPAMIERGLKDPELSGISLNGPAVGIMHEGECVGWHAPRQDKGGWRVGAIYIDPQFRGRGIAGSVVRDFLSDKDAADVPIRVGNESSERMFSSAGFVPTGREIVHEGETLHWWTRPKVTKEAATISHSYTDRRDRDTELWRKWKSSRSPDDLRALSRSMEPVIHAETQRWGGQIPDYALRANANLYMLKAFETYDPNSGAALSTHVINHLRKLSREVYKNQDIVRMPENMKIESTTIFRAKQELSGQFGREPTNEELADHLGWSLSRISRVERSQISEFVGSRDEGQDIFSEAGSGTGHTARVDFAYSAMSPVQKQVFSALTGYGGAKILTRDELAKSMGPSMTPDRLRTIIAEVQRITATAGVGRD
jgi:hypothetical protein